jgi:GNAT superfamily N-acetyltransferase
VTATAPEIEVLPATAERWPDLEALFGRNGAHVGCWCMFWRLDRSKLKALKGNSAKKLLKSMTCQDKAPGVLAYVERRPIGWCSIGPRPDYPALENSRILKPVDDRPVWSVVCFYVAKDMRRQGVMLALLHGAIAYARQQGAKIVEGYPIDMQTPKMASHPLHGCTGYMGIASVYRTAGFREVGRASDTQLIMRLSLAGQGNRK